MHKPVEKEPNAPITIESVAYWRLRLRATEHELLSVRLQAQIDKSKADLDAACVAAGLTVGVNYTLDDATCAAIAAP